MKRITKNTTFYLVRHGTKVRAIGDVPLSPEGVLEAQQTARHLCRLPLAEIVSSPLRRAADTAGYIAEASGLPVHTDARLRERANWGDLAGQTFEEFVRMWEQCTRNRDEVPPVGDSARQAGGRLSSLLSEQARQHPGKHLALVTHGGLITDFLINAFPESELNRWHPSFVSRQSELVPECSITTVLSGGNGMFVLAGFASIRHLQK
ncbi:histidine phosphatase family protein [Paenibacillus sp. XY044]|uniref:histidine phosphatase family protein n=1 Tax=Paenibacillus sp. XY044 TaxID=2026089 RepID=UPI000B984FEF|nr:histidine phosphatase family protein [Paenibacillus sp. XY044]OZB92922.1 histidine phosphatase family protein [Paenibacillus sp. XY044]